jgi:hypothetical protein
MRPASIEISDRNTRDLPLRAAHEVARPPQSTDCRNDGALFEGRAAAHRFSLLCRSIRKEITLSREDRPSLSQETSNR